MTDEKNPAYLFQGINTELLTAIVNGQIDPKALASKELASRGLDSTGTWVGFDKATNLHLIRTRRGTAYTRKGKKVSVSIPE